MRKTYVLTVIGELDGQERVISTEIVPPKTEYDHGVMAAVLAIWLKTHGCDYCDSVRWDLAEQLAPALCETGCVWWKETYGFCLTELVG